MQRVDRTILQKPALGGLVRLVPADYFALTLCIFKRIVYFLQAAAFAYFLIYFADADNLIEFAYIKIPGGRHYIYIR